MRRLLCKENIVPAALLAFVSWLGVNAISSKEAIASLQASQKEDHRVNQIVYKFDKVLPVINDNLNDIKTELTDNKILFVNVIQSQEQTKNKLYCISTFPVGSDTKSTDPNVESRDRCIQQLVGGY